MRLRRAVQGISNRFLQKGHRVILLFPFSPFPLEDTGQASHLFRALCRLPCQNSIRKLRAAKAATVPK